MAARASRWRPQATPAPASGLGLAARHTHLAPDKTAVAASEPDPNPQRGQHRHPYRDRSPRPPTRSSLEPCRWFSNPPLPGSEHRAAGRTPAPMAHPALDSAVSGLPLSGGVETRGRLFGTFPGRCSSPNTETVVMNICLAFAPCPNRARSTNCSTTRHGFRIGAVPIQLRMATTTSQFPPTLLPLALAHVTMKCMHFAKPPNRTRHKNRGQRNDWNCSCRHKLGFRSSWTSKGDSDKEQRRRTWSFVSTK